MFPLRDNVSRSREPVVVWAIIALNAAAFLYQLGLSPEELQVFLYEHALVPVRYFSPRWSYQVGLSPTDFTPFLTNTFLHGGFLHIILNMWTLWIFGPALEDRLGPVRFTVLYLLSGVAASVAHALFNADSTVPVLGASGAIAGIIAAYAVRFPFALVRVLVPIIIIPLFFDVPAMVFAGIWFFVQVLQGASELLSPFAGAGIAWWAHIGGFLAGLMLLAWLEQSGRPAVRYNGGPWER
ncbi:MAG TPA: rhomboid family intramembrane serine protease [Hyphomicrobiaceae bacterium]|nr:rhomboid family intramembrane serine protease [Hyphomicrobiaceae bacterium]